MKLSRSQALILSKVLFQFNTVDGMRYITGLSEVQSSIDEFLSSEPDASCEHYCDSPDVPDLGDEDEYDDDEVDDEVDDDSIDNIADGEVKADTLHKLTLQRAVATSTSLLEEIDDLELDSVELSFEATYDDDNVVECVDLLVCEGQCIVGDIDFVRRSGTEIQVHERGIGWHKFSVNKFNKDWTKAIPVNKTLEVVE